MHVNDLSYQILKAAYEVHSELGPGLLESVYETTITYELKAKGLKVQNQIPIPIRYKGLLLESAFRADLIINECVLIELKSVNEVHEVHKKQVLSYLRLTQLPLGLLLNFNVASLKNGITRIVNHLSENSA